MGSKDMVLIRFELKKERMSRRNFILQSVCPGVSILSRFQNVQHHKVARATQTFFSNELLRSCHKCFSTTVSLPVFISLYLILSSLQQQMQSAYISPSRIAYQHAQGASLII